MHDFQENVQESENDPLRDWRTMEESVVIEAEQEAKGTGYFTCNRDKTEQATSDVRSRRTIPRTRCRYGHSLIVRCRPAHVSQSIRHSR